MKVVYLEYSVGIEQKILQAFLSKEGAEVKIGELSIKLPLVVNVTAYNMDRLKALGNSMYKWITDLRTVRQPSEATLDRFGYRIQRIVKTAKSTGQDLLVIYDPEENIDLIRDEIKLWIRTLK